MKYYLLLLLVPIHTILNAQDLKISLKHGDSVEQEAKIQLERIIKTYRNEINTWFFTKNIQINKNTIPFSHPVLTLNCSYLDNDLKQLSNFLHEQFHWLEETMPEQRKKAINEFKQLFPNAPVKGKEGAQNEYSTYLHLIVCFLEYQAMAKVVGEESAKQILSEKNYYKWIYEKVLNDNRIREVIIKNNFLIL